MKENEIQIVTLEKQKDTYQVIFQKTRKIPKISHVLDVVNKEFCVNYFYEIMRRLSGVWESNRSSISLECYTKNNRVHPHYEQNVQVLFSFQKTIEFYDQI